MTQKVLLGFIPSLTMNYCSFHGVRTATQSYWLYSDSSVMKARVCSGWRFPAHIIIFLFLYYSSSGTIWQFRQKVEHKRLIPVSRVTPAHMKFHTRVTHSLYTYHETYTVRMCCFIFNYILCLFSVCLCLFVFVLIYLCLRVCMSVCPCVCVWCVSVCTYVCLLAWHSTFMKSEDNLPELVLFLYYTEAWSHQTGQQAPLSSEPSQQPYKGNLTVLVLKWRLKDFCQMMAWL